jgi:hypothetical protein
MDQGKLRPHVPVLLIIFQTSRQQAIIGLFHSTFVTGLVRGPHLTPIPMLHDTTTLPPIPVNDVIPRHASVVEPAVIPLVARAVDRNGLIAPHPREEVKGTLGAVG